MGMELINAELVAECSIKEIEKIEKDKEFMDSVDRQYAVQEFELLKKHNMAMDIAVCRGQANAVQWKLGKINRQRWGGDFIEVPPEIDNMHVTLVGVGPKANGRKSRDSSKS